MNFSNGLQGNTLKESNIALFVDLNQLEYVPKSLTSYFVEHPPYSLKLLHHLFVESHDSLMINLTLHYILEVFTNPPNPNQVKFFGF